MARFEGTTTSPQRAELSGCSSSRKISCLLINNKYEKKAILDLIKKVCFLFNNNYLLKITKKVILGGCKKKRLFFEKSKIPANMQPLLSFSVHLSM